jgi:acyl-coenzyme A synthetase/AMP-(fatty) acid ligase
MASMRRHADKDAIIVNDVPCRHGDLLDRCRAARSWLREKRIPEGAVVSFDGDYTAEAIAFFVALAENRNIIVPLSRDAGAHHSEFKGIAQGEYHIHLSGVQPSFAVTGSAADHAHYETLRERGAPGLVLFSSGSTGKPKGIVQDLNKLMVKFQAPGKPLRMIIFLQLDHIGGINSLLYSLASGGAAIVPADRSPAAVCDAIEHHRGQLLPTSPTFLNLLILSREFEGRDLSPLQLVTYGTEPMPESTLTVFHSLFPWVELKQTYGMSELGILRSRSRGSDSLWVKVGGEGYQVKIVDDRLRIKSDSAMLGYLNAPDPFDEEGFLDTGDRVEQDGDWIRILGRESEIINVGGLKVFPAEVESVLLEMDNVSDAVVFGQPHPITGHIVAAKVKLKKAEPLKGFKSRMRRFAKDRLQPYKIPAKVHLVEDILHNDRYKRMRRMETAVPYENG